MNEVLTSWWTVWSSGTAYCVYLLIAGQALVVSLYFSDQMEVKVVSAVIWCRWMSVFSAGGFLAALLIMWQDLTTLVLTALGPTYNVLVTVSGTLLKVWDRVLRK